MHTTEITNVLTREKTIFVNNLSTKENLISFLVLKNNQGSNLLNPEIRKLYTDMIIEKTSKAGDQISICIKYDLISKIIK